jgi:polysaccharide biosynthesis transport protein
MNLPIEEERQTASPERGFMGRLAGGVGEPHLKDYLHVLLMRRWVVIGISLLIILSTAVVVFLMTPIYRATSLLLIEPAKLNITQFQDVYDPTMSQYAGNEIARREFMETQYSLLTCAPIMEKVFAQFHFADTERFRDALDPIPDFTERFTISPVSRTRLVQVSFDWPDAKLASDVVNYLVDLYMQDYRDRRLGVTGGGLDALKSKAEDLRPKVSEAANNLQAFMALHGAVSLDESQNIVVERLKDLNQQLSDLQSHRMGLQSQIQSIGNALDSHTSLQDLPQIVDNQTMRDLGTEWMKAQQDIGDLMLRFGENHPAVLASRAKQEALRQQMEMVVRSILTSINIEYQNAKVQEDQILAALDLQSKEVINLDRLRVEYEMLKGAYDTINQTYQAIMGRIQQIEISSAAGSEEDNMFIIAPAKVPVRPDHPKRVLIVFLACMLGPLCGVTLAFFMQYLDTTVKTRDEIEKLVGLPVLGYVPALRDELNGGAATGLQGGRAEFDMLAIHRPRSALAEAFRSLRTALSFSVGSQGIRSMLVTSPSPLEGKSLVSINLAFAFAQAGKRVLLVDSDMRKPRLHKTFSIAPTIGLSNLLAGEGAGVIDDACHETGIENLFLLPSGPRPPNPAELLATDRMRELIQHLEERFDYVIFDTPPVVNVTDSSILMHLVDGGLLVVRSFTTQRGLAQRAAELLSGTQGRVLGVIMNNADLPKGAYGYEGYYYYYSSYYYYYGDSDGDTTKKRRRKEAPWKRRGGGGSGDGRPSSFWRSWFNRAPKETKSAEPPQQEQPPEESRPLPS